MRERRTGKRSQRAIQAEEKAKKLADALLLGIPVDEVDGAKANYFAKLAEQEKAAEEAAMNADLKEDAARDAAKWAGTESAISGDSSLTPFTEKVDLKIDPKTGKFNDSTQHD